MQYIEAKSANESHKSQFKFDLDKRPNPYRPFTYELFDYDPANRKLNEALLLPTIARRDTVQNILDVGCATGANAQMIINELGRQKTPAVFTGLDFDESAVRAAGRYVEGNDVVTASFVRGDVTQIPIEDKTQDTIYFTGIYHELQGEDENGNSLQEKALAEIYRVLKPGGTLILVSAFTRETFSERTELARQMKVRERAQKLLGVERDRSVTPFKLDPNSEVLANLQKAGFHASDEDIVIQTAFYTVDSQRAIAEDIEYNRGTAMNWKLPEGIGLEHVREAYHQSLDEEEREFANENRERIERGEEPVPELLYPRHVTRIIARKPLSEPLETDVFRAA